jgi:hypothetical protein
VFGFEGMIKALCIARSFFLCLFMNEPVLYLPDFKLSWRK